MKGTPTWLIVLGGGAVAILAAYLIMGKTSAASSGSSTSTSSGDVNAPSQSSGSTAATTGTSDPAATSLSSGMIEPQYALQGASEPLAYVNGTPYYLTPPGADASGVTPAATNQASLGMYYVNPSVAPVWWSQTSASSGTPSPTG